MSMVSEFKAFISRGNVMDLAVGVIIGGAFGKIVDSFVADIVMPLVGKLGGQPDFSAWKIADSINIGLFLNAVIGFLILAFAVFMMVKAVNRFQKPVAAEAPATPEDILLLREIRDNLKK